MTRRRAFVIAGQRVPLGESRTISLKFSESYLGSPAVVPIHVIRAKKPGPRLLLTGCVHGDELNGMGIIRELLYDQPPKLMCGSLVCIPVVNVYGLEHHTRYLPDRRDLNRDFPGAERGSISSRLAHVIFNKVVRQCDLLVDFHSAAVRRTNYPNIRADLTVPKVRALARSFGCELIVNGKGPVGSLRRAATAAGIPCIILEAGEVWKIESSVVEVGVRGVMNVLKNLGMVRGKVTPPRYQTRVDRTTWVRAERGGTLSFHVNPGDLVEKGQLLASNYNIFGDERNQLVSPGDGIILGMTTMPVVKPGDAAFHIALISRSRLLRIRKKIQESSSRDLFNRVHADLATNVHQV
ncbi:MAG: succinylglutamate desuccinylase/aspartoacylase family protein [Candidatus Hydrogenedentes bacterium]|nr:succinylglutamate desuccinylase/aspartoacylase family protein [Candidatus Hydrogenedentota bacterium]